VGSHGVGCRTCPPGSPRHSRPRGVRSRLPLDHSAERPRSPRDPPDREGAPQMMGGHGDRPAARRTGTDSAPEPAGSGPGAAAAQRPAAGPGLEDALHGAPDLLAALAMAGEAQPGGRRPSHALRLVSKACREAVDGAATRSRLDFPCARSRVAGPGGCAWIEPMVRRLARAPRLAELTCCEPSGVELEQLLSGAAARQPSPVAGVQRLEVCTTSAEADVLGPGLPAAAALAGPPARPAGVCAGTCVAGEAQPGPSHALRLVCKSCCEAVDSAAGSLRVGFGMEGQAWVDAVVRRMGKLPRLAGVTFCDPSVGELEQLMGMAAARQPSAVAGLQRLEVAASEYTTSAEADVFGPGLPALLRSLAHLPSLQVCMVGWPETMCVYR
jgi:hypothetical protein